MRSVMPIGITIDATKEVAVETPLIRRVEFVAVEQSWIIEIKRVHWKTPPVWNEFMLIDWIQKKKETKKNKNNNEKESFFFTFSTFNGLMMTSKDSETHCVNKRRSSLFDERKRINGSIFFLEKSREKRLNVNKSLLCGFTRILIVKLFLHIDRGEEQHFLVLFTFCFDWRWNRWKDQIVCEISVRLVSFLLDRDLILLIWHLTIIDIQNMSFESMNIDRIQTIRTKILMNFSFVRLTTNVSHFNLIRFSSIRKEKWKRSNAKINMTISSVFLSFFFLFRRISFLFWWTWWKKK